MNDDAILVRWGEIFLKGGNRGFFERRLVDETKRAVGAFARVERLHGRLLVWPREGEAPKTLARLQRVFGVASLSAVRVVGKNLAALTAAAVEEARAHVDSVGGKPSFKVETRRADKRFQPASPEVSRLVGAAIVEALALPVDVHAPSFTVGIEVGFEHAYAWARTVPGPGGLPIGASGKVDLLLSGGIDSPVAGWMAMKRGCHVAATYFHSFPFTGDKTKEKVAGLARLLARWQGEVALRVVGFTDAQKALRDTGEPRLAVVLYRRMMVRVAERLARARGALALVTGEAIGQVASQTLPNLAAIEEAATLPILRPLVAHDKLETIAWAKRIGTYDLSIAPYEDCCALFVPEHPETKAKLDDVKACESRVDVEALVQQCLERVETIVCTD